MDWTVSIPGCVAVGTFHSGTVIATEEVVAIPNLVAE
jgi:hypothetical protein